MFEALTEGCVLGVDPCFVVERPRNEFDGYRRGRRAIEGRFSLCVLISFAQS